MNEFRTKRLAFAVFLHVIKATPYLRAEVDEKDGRVSFVFEDDPNLGPRLEVDFDGGCLVPAINLFSSQTYLRRQIAAAQNGETSNVRSHTR